MDACSLRSSDLHGGVLLHGLTRNDKRSERCGEHEKHPRSELKPARGGEAHDRRAVGDDGRLVDLGLNALPQIALGRHVLGQRRQHLAQRIADLFRGSLIVRLRRQAHALA